MFSDLVFKHTYIDKFLSFGYRKHAVIDQLFETFDVCLNVERCIAAESVSQNLLTL